MPEASKSTNYYLNIGSNYVQYGTPHGHKIEYKLPGHKDFEIVCTRNDCKRASKLLVDVSLDAFINHVTHILPRELAEREVLKQEKALSKAKDALNSLIIANNRRATP